MSTSPRSASCRTATAVKVLVIEATRKTVSCATGLREVTSANPRPARNATPSARTTPSARPTAGRRFRIPSTALVS
jgi:hypothetical protein